MDPVWLLLLLPLAAAGGWFMAVHEHSGSAKSEKLPDAYFKGLNFLLNEQPDKALQVFLEVVEVDKETVEMHMALGNLFRRRGEIERATRIHQNLVARTDLDDGLRSMALFELAQDYFKAGLFDRAENLFQELRQVVDYREQACRFLLQIYDQEKEWQNAISVAKDLNRLSETDYSISIAHYYCELAEKSVDDGNYHISEKYLESAFKNDSKCVRAVIQSGRIAALRNNHASAITIWRGLEYWAPESLGEVAGYIAASYNELNDMRSLRNFLESAVQKNPDPRIIAMLVELTGSDQGRDARHSMLMDLVRKYPSLENLYQVMRSRSQKAVTSREDRDFSMLADVLSEVVESGRNYSCKQCGFQSTSLHWQCPGCKGWGTVQRPVATKSVFSLPQLDTNKA